MGKKDQSFTLLVQEKRRKHMMDAIMIRGEELAPDQAGLL